MTEQECIDTFNRLSKILDEEGLGWLAAAVAAEIREGVIEMASERDLTRTLLNEGLIHPSREHRQAPGRADFVVRREFSNAERLHLLVDALDEVTLEANEIEREMLRFFRESRGPSQIQFVDTQAAAPLASETDEAVNRRSTAVEKLRHLLEELRREITA